MNDYIALKFMGLETMNMKNFKPESVVEFEKMTGDKLLSLLNEWPGPEKLRMDADFAGPAKEFEFFFMESVLPDETRLGFWIDNLEQIRRPVYVWTMVSAMHKHVRLGKFDRIDQCFGLCEWVLSRAEWPMQDGVESLRRAVGDFVGMCLQEDVDVPIAWRHRIASLLDKLCTQYDRILDGGEEPASSDQDDLLNEAISNMRGQALNNLVDFGYWVRRQQEDAQADVTEVFSILSKRFDPQCEHPMTLPECAMLGSHYNLIFSWNPEWAIRHKNQIFPQNNQKAWAIAFGHYLNENRPHKPMFDIVRDDIILALNNMDQFNTKGFDGVDPVDSLGRHLSSYFFWGIYPLTGGDSLLESFYDKTSEDRWACLFDSIGRGLKFIDEQLDDELERNIMEFAEWRLKKQNSSELKEFTFWLEAECLDEEWRLNLYSKILDTYGLQDIHEPDESNRLEVLYSEYQEMNILREMADSHTALVLECLAKLTSLTIKNKGDHYSLAREAKPIFEAGLASDNADTRKKAEQAQKLLLQCGQSDR